MNNNCSANAGTTKYCALRITALTILIFPLILCVTTVANADRVQGVYCAQAAPVAARGGVMLLVLNAETHGDNWPTTIRVQYQPDKIIEGRVIWQSRSTRQVDVHWTSPVVNMKIRPIQKQDDTSAGNGIPLLLVEVPENARGKVQILGDTFSPTWCDIPDDPFGIASEIDDTYPLKLIHALDLPDPESPYEYWRWVLVASKNKTTPPPQAGNEIEIQVARYFADLWKIGFGRLALHSLGIAKECRDILTTTCFDKKDSFAAWVTDPEVLRQLLSTLLDFSLTSDELVKQALLWADSRDKLFFWYVGDHGNQIELAIVNTSRNAKIVRFQWMFSDPELTAKQIPMGVEITPLRLQRVLVDRPVESLISEVEKTPHSEPVLTLESEHLQKRFQVRPEQLNAKPPGLFFGPFTSLLTLADARMAGQQLPPPEYSTNASFRRLDGRWEVFFECFRPQPNTTAPPPSTFTFAEMNKVSETLGIESVSLLIGPPENPSAAVTVPENGVHYIWTGDRDDSFQIHRRSFNDRWYCRIVIPDTWLDYPLSRVIQIGMLRTHGDSNAMQTSPNTTTPWMLETSRIKVNLNQWLDMPPTTGSNNY